MREPTSLLVNEPVGSSIQLSDDVRLDRQLRRDVDARRVEGEAGAVAVVERALLEQARAGDLALLPHLVADAAGGEVVSARRAPWRRARS